MTSASSISPEVAEGPFSNSSVWDLEADGAFRDWLIASFSSNSEGPSFFPDGEGDLESALTSHPLFRRLLEAVLACQRAAQVDTQKILPDYAVHTVEACDQSDGKWPDGSGNEELTAFLMNYCVVLENIASQLLKAHETINYICEKQQETFVNLNCDANKGRSVLNAAMSEPAVRMRYRCAIRDLKTELINKRKRGRLPAQSTAVLTAWWSEHKRWPYPTESEKLNLCASTGLNAVQLNNWFINRRKRQWSKVNEDD